MSFGPNSVLPACLLFKQQACYRSPLCARVQTDWSLEASQEKTDQLILAEREPPLLAGWTGEMDELILGKRIGQIILFLILGTEISLDKLDLIPSRFSQGEYKLKGKDKNVLIRTSNLKIRKGQLSTFTNTGKRNMQEKSQKLRGHF